MEKSKEELVGGAEVNANEDAVTKKRKKNRNKKQRKKEKEVK